ncbi:hypothetical protein [Legionella tunisiensis]|uniref:hypothetical protein n=1 Tax=Legionella tunisiensis TaxID=1034944 RepID=UPI0002DC5884|nr:hypothetical protein [Legionella tunisiensis]
MLRINKKLVVLGVFALLQACTQVDDYMLGKDNTPTPTPLEPLKTKVSLIEKWSVPAGGTQKITLT